MAIFKSFRVQIVDSPAPDANVLHDLGPCVIPILEWKADAVYGDRWVERDYFSAYTDDYLLAGGPNLNGNPNNAEHVETMRKLQEIAPLAVDRGVHGVFASGNYVRLISDSGYYATSESAAVQNVDREYDPHGNLMTGSTIADVLWSAPNRQPASCMFFTGEIVDGQIVSLKNSFVVNGERVDRSTYHVTVRNVSVGDPPNLITWLNQCTTQKEDKPQTITVSWARPGDGKVLTDTYDIDVAPPSATGGNTGGNTGGGGTEEGGGGGGHAF